MRCSSMATTARSVPPGSTSADRALIVRGDPTQKSKLAWRWSIRAYVVPP
jgi:hypothetical protein